jgi:hypothetical protein
MVRFSGFLTKILYAFHISTMHATFLTHIILLEFITLTILGEAYKCESIMHNCNVTSLAKESLGLCEFK